MDETLYNVSEKVQNFAVIYLGTFSFDFPVVFSTGMKLICLVDITEVPDFNKVASAFPHVSLGRWGNEVKADEVDVRAIRPMYTHVLLSVSFPVPGNRNAYADIS